MKIKATRVNEPNIKLIVEALIELSDRTYKKKPQEEKILKKAE